MVTNVKGSFKEFTGSLHLDGSDPSKSTASIDVVMDSIDTGSADRDGHLKSADFFKTDEFPTMTFRSTQVEAAGDGEYRVTGDLTILGTTRPLTIDVEYNGAATDPFGNQRVGFEGKAEILRSDWGLSWNAVLETGGFLASDKIKPNAAGAATRNARSRRRGPAAPPPERARLAGTPCRKAGARRVRGAPSRTGERFSGRPSPPGPDHSEAAAEVPAAAEVAAAEPAAEATAEVAGIEVGTGQVTAL